MSEGPRVEVAASQGPDRTQVWGALLRNYRAVFFIKGTVLALAGFLVPGWGALLVVGPALAIAGLALKRDRSLASYLLSAVYAAAWLAAAVTLVTRSVPGLPPSDDPAVANLAGWLAVAILLSPGLLGLFLGKRLSHLLDRLDAATGRTGL